MRIVWIATAVVALALAACGGGGGEADGLSGDALVARGQELFEGEGTCAICHGPQLQGTNQGPSFIDDIYAPDHHPDEAFYRAVENGVQPHHHDFGPMPALSHLEEEDVRAIVAYVRSVQRKNGIE